MAGDDGSKNLNERQREKIAGELRSGEEILAMIALNDTIGMGKGATSTGQSTVFSTEYAKGLGIDYSDRLLRADLVASWCTVTQDRILFHKHKQMALRPTPGDFIDEVPLATTTLRHFEAGGYGMSNRVVHLEFEDGRRLLSATILRANLRKKNYSDEPDLFVAAFGDRATELET